MRNIKYISFFLTTFQCSLFYISEKVEQLPFLYLTCDLPAPPLFPDELQENIIPQVPIYNILNKFCGFQEKEYKTHKDSTFKRFELTKLPPFIILFIKVIMMESLFNTIFHFHYDNILTSLLNIYVCVCVCNYIYLTCK